MSGIIPTDPILLAETPCLERSKDTVCNLKPKHLSDLQGFIFVAVVISFETFLLEYWKRNVNLLARLVKQQEENGIITRRWQTSPSDLGEVLFLGGEPAHICVYMNLCLIIL